MIYSTHPRDLHLGFLGLGSVQSDDPTRPPAPSALVYALASAIDRMEGTTFNNNPGNLRSWGSLPQSRGFALFPDLPSGWEALYRQIQLNIGRGLTLEEFFAGKPGVYSGYAPAADRNNPIQYARNVSSWTGIPLGVPLNTLDPDYPYGMVPNQDLTRTNIPGSNVGANTGVNVGVPMTAPGAISTVVRGSGTALEVLSSPITDTNTLWVIGAMGAAVVLAYLLTE